MPSRDAAAIEVDHLLAKYLEALDEIPAWIERLQVEQRQRDWMLDETDAGFQSKSFETDLVQLRTPKSSPVQPDQDAKFARLQTSKPSLVQSEQHAELQRLIDVVESIPVRYLIQSVAGLQRNDIPGPGNGQTRDTRLAEKSHVRNSDGRHHKAKGNDRYGYQIAVQSGPRLRNWVARVREDPTVQWSSSWKVGAKGEALRGFLAETGAGSRGHPSLPWRSTVTRLADELERDSDAVGHAYKNFRGALIKFVNIEEQVAFWQLGSKR